ncbi:MAG TPA: transcriptional repressor [Vicinamibacteria bacterium]|jgi:Fur family ferric uptake transcriptional regulator
MATAVGREEKEVLNAYLLKNHLKRSEQREAILDAFLRAEKHVSVDDLLNIVQKRHPDIGRTTVYRTLKLLQEAGLASELPLDGESRFEPDYKRAHHDHFICKSCGDIFEFSSPEIERLQDEAANEIGFVIQGHRHQIFGLCRPCALRAAESHR